MIHEPFQKSESFNESFYDNDTFQFLQFLRSRISSIRCWEHLANSHGRRLYSSATSKLILARYGETPSSANYSTAWRNTIPCWFFIFQNCNAVHSFAP